MGYLGRNDIDPACSCLKPLYRLYNDFMNHLYTVDQQEMHYYRTHPEHAYGFEYIECYVWQTNSSVKGCPAMLTATQGEDFLHRLY
uniref:Uncharacterized protein n=1 Tax=Ditylenchus dipsaci TaxID=166011 RepID=A0A915D9F7_9BILA